jgi:hypothetical protein
MATTDANEQADTVPFGHDASTPEPGQPSAELLAVSTSYRRLLIEQPFSLKELAQMGPDELVPFINQAHQHCERALGVGLECALRAGLLLLAAKDKVPYGQWEDWLRGHTEVTARSAQMYMYAAREWPAYLASRTEAPVSGVGFRRAVQVLRAWKGRTRPAPAPAAAPDALDVLVRGLVRTVQRWEGAHGPLGAEELEEVVRQLRARRGNGG